MGIHTGMSGRNWYLSDRTIDFEFTNEVVESTGFDRSIGETALRERFRGRGITVERCV